MHFPKYWALGTSGEYSCWQWSDSSLIDAQNRAKASAERLAAARKNTADRSSRYSYGERALREPVIQELQGPGDAPPGIVTRNSYGALVLNTSALCFVDIDLPHEKPKPRGGFFAALFGGGEKPSPAPVSDPAMERLEHWFSADRSRSGRLYRTRGGLRLIITTHPLSPSAADTEQIFGELGADPLYCRLCKSQESFRARLTPKPWRCGLDLPPARWPFRDRKDEDRFARWEESYKIQAEQFATCKLIKHFGDAEPSAEFRNLIGLHDDKTKAGSDLPLA